MNDELKIARINRRIAKDKYEAELVKAILFNPVFEIIFSYAVIEWLQKMNIIPPLAGTLAEGGCLTAIGYQQLSPLIPQLMQAQNENLGKVLESLPAIAPLLLTKGLA